MRPFTDVLRDINDGEFANELTEALADLILACSSTGKAGEISVKLELKPAKGSGAVMSIEHDYIVKAPEFDRPQQFFFITNGNTLVTENPHQQGLPFREVVDRGTSETLDDSLGEVRFVATA